MSVDSMTIGAKELLSRGLRGDVLSRFIENNDRLFKDGKDIKLEDQRFIANRPGRTPAIPTLTQMLDRRNINVSSEIMDLGHEAVCQYLINYINNSVLYWWPSLKTYKEELKEYVRGNTNCDWQFDGFAVRADAHTSYMMYRSASAGTIDMKGYEIADELEHFNVLDETYSDAIIEILNKEIELCQFAYIYVTGKAANVYSHRVDVPAGYIYYIHIGDGSGHGYTIQYKNCNYINRDLELDPEIISLAKDFS